MARMVCDACKTEMTIVSGETYRYAETGLDNVYLLNADLYVCEGCGEQLPILHRIEELHQAIARAIAFKPAPLSGAEIRFLRKELGLSGRKWAALLHIDHTTLSRWENEGQERSQHNDLLIRHVFFRMLEEQTWRLVREPVAERIASIDYESVVEQDLLVNADNPSVNSYRATAASV